MPSRPPKPCTHPGCGALVASGYCDQHRPAAEARRREALSRAGRAYNQRRPESDKFYGTAAWRAFRDAFLRSHPLCEECRSHGRLTPARIVDHIIPLRERLDLALDATNMRALCFPCHNRIGARVRGGGRPKV